MAAPEEVLDLCGTEGTATTPPALLEKLQERYRDCGAKGVFRYYLDRIVFEVTHCDEYDVDFQRLYLPQRFSNRRERVPFSTPVDPFDPAKFNFNKARARELVALLDGEAGLTGPGAVVDTKVVDGDMTIGEACGNTVDALMVNVSPWADLCMVLVPGPTENLNHVLTASSLRRAIGLSRAIDNDNFIVGYNGMMAGASVNHLHLQTCLTSATIPVEQAARTPVESCPGLARVRFPTLPVCVDIATLGVHQGAELIIALQAAAHHEGCSVNVVVAGRGARVYVFFRREDGQIWGFADIAGMMFVGDHNRDEYVTGREISAALRTAAHADVVERAIAKVSPQAGVRVE